MKKLLLGGFMLLFTLGLIGCNSTTTTTLPNNSEVKKTESEKNSWQTYQSQAANFSINYPEGYKLKEADSGGLSYVEFRKDDNNFFTVRIEKAEKETPYYRDTKATGIAKLGNLEAKQYDFPKGYCDGPGCSLPFIAIKTFQQDQEYTVEFYNITKLGTTEEEVLKSFKLLENKITPSSKENTSSLPQGVEWLTYSDKDISFVYPKTFLKTPLQEDFDKNQSGETWQVSRKEDTVYLHPNFESPATESGATYEIKIMKDASAADAEWSKAAKLHAGPESQWGEALKTSNNAYYIGVLRNLDFSLGDSFNVYALIPGGIDEKGGSKRPAEKHIIIYASPDQYSSYIENILIPSIKGK